MSLASWTYVSKGVPVQLDFQLITHGIGDGMLGYSNAEDDSSRHYDSSAFYLLCYSSLCAQKYTKSLSIPSLRLKQCHINVAWDKVPTYPMSDVYTLWY